MDVDDQESATSNGDYAKMGDSEESKESSANESFSDSHDESQPDRQKQVRKGANMRSVEAATTRSKNPIEAISPMTPGGFAFLELESYICYCMVSQPRNSRCKVLDYFGMVFVESLQALYCPAHNQITPMSLWAYHVKRSHLDWCSADKKKDCDSMARHVANSHNLSMDEKDIDLPDEINEPLSTKTKNLHLNYQCPFCGYWMAADKGSRFPERYIREKHIRDKCTKNGPCPRYNDVELEEPRWIFKVKVSATGKYHSFVLPLEWENCDDEDLEPTLSLEPPSLDLDTTLIHLSCRQEWPLMLGWHAYDQEISANDHVVALRSLISLPRRNTPSTPDTPFLEKRLSLIRGAIVTYFRTAVLFVHNKHKRVVDVITLEYVLPSKLVVYDK
jgi:hypothetical protein